MGGHGAKEIRPIARPDEILLADEFSKPAAARVARLKEQYEEE
jgi:hypothetical protein